MEVLFLKVQLVGNKNLHLPKEYNKIWGKGQRNSPYEMNERRKFT
jgi:hypothetical protein